MLYDRFLEIMRRLNVNKICKMAMLIAVTLILLVITNIFGTQGANNNNSAISDQKLRTSIASMTPTCII